MYLRNAERAVPLPPHRAGAAGTPVERPGNRGRRRDV